MLEQMREAFERFGAVDKVQIITDKLTGTFDVNNLLDRKYVSRVGSVGTFNFYGPSRSFTVGARYEF